MANAIRYKRSNETFDFGMDIGDDRVGSETIGTATVVSTDSSGVDRSAVVTDAVIFTGLGLNDATSGGTNTNTTDTIYTITIDAIGGTDTFSWLRTGGSTTTGVSITGSAQTLDNGITITFAATTGHALSDRWTIKATIAMVASVADTGTVMNAQLSGGTDGMDYEIVYSAPMSGTPADTWSRVLLLRVRDSNIGAS